MNKDEEIKHLTALNERNHSQITEMKRLLSMTENSLRHARNTQEELHRQLTVTHKEWIEGKDALDSLSRRFERLMLERDNLDDQNMQLQNLLYATISMLSEQDADDVLSQLDKIQRRTEI